MFTKVCGFCINSLLAIAFHDYVCIHARCAVRAATPKGWMLAVSLIEPSREFFVDLARISRDRLLEAFDTVTLAGAATKLRSALRMP